MIEKINKIYKSKITSSSTFVMSANVFSQFVSFIFIMLISRVLSIRDYGIYAVLITILTTIADLADMGMNGSVTRFVAEYHEKNRINEESSIISSSLRRKLFNSLLIITIMVCFSKNIASIILNDSSMYFYIVIISIGVVFSLINGMNIAILLGRQNFYKYFCLIVASNFFLLICIIMLYLTHSMNLVNIIITNVFYMLSSLILSSKMVKFNIMSIFNNSSENTYALRRFKIFGNWMFIWSLCAILQSRTDLFLLAKLSTIEQVSYYDIAYKMTKPILLFTSSYAQVLNPLLASENSKYRLVGKVNTIIKFIIIISCCILFAIIISGPLINLFFRTKYNSSVIPLRILLISLIFYVWTIPFNSALYALNKPHIFAIAAFAGLVSTVFGDILLLNNYGAIGAAITFLIAQVISLIIAYSAYRKYINKDTLEGGLSE